MNLCTDYHPHPTNDQPGTQRQVTGSKTGHPRCEPHDISPVLSHGFPLTLCGPHHPVNALQPQTSLLIQL